MMIAVESPEGTSGGSTGLYSVAIVVGMYSGEGGVYGFGTYSREILLLTSFLFSAGLLMA